MVATEVTKERTSVSIGIDGDKLPFGKFLSIQSAFFEMLKDVSGQFFDGKGFVSWSLLAASTNSPYICEVLPSPKRKSVTEEDVIGLVEIFNYGLSSIGERAEWPPFFTDFSVKKIKKIGDEIDGKIISNVFLGGKVHGREKWRTGLSGNVFANASKLLEAKYESYDSVEGKLLAIDLHNKTAFRLYTNDESESLLCNFPSELEEKAISAIKKRVYVYGLTKERENGRKVSMNVKEIDILPESYEIPLIHEILQMGMS